MAVSKVRFYFPRASASSSALGRVNFITKVNGVSGNYDVGKAISNTETDNVLIEYKGFSSSVNYTNAILNNDIFLDASSKEAYIDFIFKENLAILGKITYTTFKGSGKTPKLYITVYDEHGEIIHDNKSAPLSSTAGQIVSEATPESRYVKVYKTHTISYIETTDKNHFTNIYQIKDIELGCVENDKEKNFCRFLFSFDNRVTYKTFNIETGMWEDCDKSDIITKGLSVDNLHLCINSINEQLDSTLQSLDILVGMMTLDAYTSPIIKNIALNYLSYVQTNDVE